jgi:HK97 family phage prohead protease
MSESERRFTPGRVEVRAAAADKRTIGGYAAKFNKPSQNLGGFIEVIDARAFNDSRGRDWPDVLARYNHDDNMLLGTTAARTLRLDIDGTGLTYEVDTPQSRSDVYELVQRGDVAKSSFAFRVIGDEGDEWGLSDQNFPMRTLRNVQLVDVAPVNTPAYLDTSSGSAVAGEACAGAAGGGAEAGRDG